VDTETTIPIFLPGRHFEVKLTRSDFEELIRAQVDSTIGALSRTLRSARVEPAELGAVLLVGGSSRIPLVAQMVSAELGRPIVVDTHPKYAWASAPQPWRPTHPPAGCAPSSPAGAAAAAPPPKLKEVPVQEPTRQAHRLPPPPQQPAPNQQAPNQQAPKPTTPRQPTAEPTSAESTSTQSTSAEAGPATGCAATPTGSRARLLAGPTGHHADPAGLGLPPGCRPGPRRDALRHPPAGRLAPVRPQAPPGRPPYALRRPPRAPGSRHGRSRRARSGTTTAGHPRRNVRAGAGCLIGAMVLIVLALAGAAYLVLLRPSASGSTGTGSGTATATAQLTLTTVAGPVQRHVLRHGDRVRARREGHVLLDRPDQRRDGLVPHPTRPAARHTGRSSSGTRRANT